MRREYHRWNSPALGRDMELLVFGHAGPRAVAFPTSMGRFYDWEDRGLVECLGERLRDGRLQLICVDSVDGESWYAEGRPPAERARRHQQFDQYIHEEVLPFSAGLNPNSLVITAGASFGAYHAINFAFRHPDRIGRALGMSGLYDIRRFVGSHFDDNVYFNNPCDYLVNEYDAERLAALRRIDLILAVGREDSLRANNEHLSRILWSKGVWHALRLWDGFAHDWPVWQQMLPLYIGGHD